MRKVFLYAFTVLLLGLPVALFVGGSFNFVQAAQQATQGSNIGLDEACNDPEAKNSTYCQNQVKQADPDKDPVTDLIKKITNVIAWIGGIIAVIFMIYAGFRYVISAGNPEKTSAALKTIIYSLVGLIVIIAARTIIVFVINRLA